MNEELKPCPFCGSRDDRPWKHEKHCYLRLWSDFQESYFLSGKSAAQNRYPSEELKKAWNTRCERECNNVAEYSLGFECSECHFNVATDPTYGYDWNTRNWKTCPNCGAKVVRE